jgi:hypothetical protein
VYFAALSIQYIFLILLFLSQSHRLSMNLAMVAIVAMVNGNHRA